MGGDVIIQTPAINLTGTDPSILGWHRETTFLNSYPPKGEPNIFVIGAYNGTIAALLIDQLPDAVHWLFEPQDWAAKQLREKFGHLSNVHIHEHALGDCSGTLRMGLYGSDMCSFMRGPTPFKDIPSTWFDGEMVEFDEFMESQELDWVYYASLNIEGYEYILLPHVAKLGWIKRWQTIGISWHDARYNSPIPGPFTYLGNPAPIYEEMQELLAKTHELVLSIDNWQTWVRKDE